MKKIFGFVYEGRYAIIILVTYLLTIIGCVVPTGSMKPTIECGDRFVTVRSYLCEIEQKDIIAFRFPDDEKMVYCKRVIGMPGDVIHSFDGYIFVQSKIKPNCSIWMRENYVKQTLGDNWTFYIPKKGDKVDVNDGNASINGYYVGEAKSFLEYYCENGIVKEDCYFCMGDNRCNSHDSRYWKHHFVKKSKIISEFKLCFFSKNIKHLGFV